MRTITREEVTRRMNQYQSQGLLQQPEMDTSVPIQGGPGQRNTVTGQMNPMSGVTPAPMPTKPSNTMWSVTQPKKSNPLGDLLGGAAKAVGEIALQPARFIERAGKALGTIGMDEEQKKRVDDFMGPGIQEKVLGKGYETPTYQNAQQVAGGAIQAAANLATPFVGGVGAMAAQGGAQSFGKALEEDKTIGEAALSGVVGAGTSAAIGGGMKLFGGLVGKGKDAIKEALKPLAKKIAPRATGLSKKEIAMAFDEFPEVTAEKLKILEDAATPEDAQRILKTSLLKNVRGVAERGKAAAETQFDDALNAVKAEFPDVQGDLTSVYKSARSKLRGAVSFSGDEREALEGVTTTLRNHRDGSIDGMRALLRDLWSAVERTDQGTPARRIATETWNDVRGELSRVTSKEVDGVTKSALDDAFSKYGKFKENWLELKPVWSENMSEDTSRNFVANLSSSNKTASRDAIKYLEDIAGIQGAVDPEITIHRLAQYLMKNEKVTGSRTGDILLGFGVPAAGALAGGAIGGVVGGEQGKNVGAFIGGIAGAKTLAPAAISKILLTELKGSGVATTNAFRQKLGKMLADPKTAQVLLRMLQGSPASDEEQNPTIIKEEINRRMTEYKTQGLIE